MDGSRAKFVGVRLRVAFYFLIVSGITGSLSAQDSGWTATADTLWLNRSNSSEGVLGFNTANPVQSLNASDNDFGTQAGFDLSLLRNLDSDRAIELRYFEIDDWSSSSSIATTPNELLQFNSVVPVFTLSGTSMVSQFDSKLLNTEINLLGLRHGCFRMLYGVRYLELDEQGGTALDGSIVPTTINTTTANRLYGFQTGLSATLLQRKCFSLDAIGKAGIYGNARSQNSNVSSGLGNLSAVGRRSSSAFVGELGLVGNARLTSDLSIRGGYRMLWVDGVALAMDQAAASDFFSGNGLNSSGDAFYQGGFLGLSLDF